MIGIFRPYLPVLTDEHRATVKQIHCSGCVAVRSAASWPTAITYCYEADVLLALLGSHGLLADAAVDRRACTALPLLSRRTIALPPRVARVVASFSVVVAWAVAADHERDRDTVMGQFLRRTLDPHLEKSLEYLEVDGGAPPDPRGLATVDVDHAASMADVVATYEPYVAGLWRAAFTASHASGLSGDHGAAVALLLSRVTILTDLWLDRHEDAACGRATPLATEGSAEAAVAQIRSDLSELVVLTSGGRSPFREILQNTFAAGVPTAISRRARRSGGTA